MQRVQAWRQQKLRFRYGQALFDGLAVTVVTVIFAERYLGNGLYAPSFMRSLLTSHELAFSLAIGLIATGTLGIRHAYDTRRMGVGSGQYRAIFQACFIWMMLALTYLALINPAAPRLPIFIWLLSIFLAVLISHSVVRVYLRSQRMQGKFMRRTMIVSRVGHASRLVETLNSPNNGTMVIGACLDAEPDANQFKARWRVGGLNRIAAIAQQWHVDLIVVSAAAVNAHQLREIGWQVEDLDVELMVAPAVEEVSESRMELHPVAGTPLLSMALGHSRTQRAVKATFDFIFSLAAILAFLPLFTVIGLLIKLDSKGSVFYRQLRVGRGGEEFSMLKFRTMHPDADARLAQLQAEHDGNDVLFKLKDDPRVTRVGKVLRRFSLDELPQLWNVVKGEMSLIGPRPPLPHEAEKYDDDARQRLRVKPGMTGLWQVSGRSDLPWDESVRLDIYYADNASLALDLQILARTVWAVLGGKGAY